MAGASPHFKEKSRLMRSGDSLDVHAICHYTEVAALMGQRLWRCPWAGGGAGNAPLLLRIYSCSDQALKSLPIMAIIRTRKGQRWRWGGKLPRAAGSNTVLIKVGVGRRDLKWKLLNGRAITLFWARTGAQCPALRDGVMNLRRVGWKLDSFPPCYDGSGKAVAQHVHRGPGHVH